ncbi:MAG TPA: cyclic nucleotide-binding domain-containing protein [Actinomycetota bacterium]|nr:cyclic nucleotide-binding domain-containing protein [Actinomycetota bacterium]
MRITSSVTSVSWIPSEAVKGLSRLVFDLGVVLYDRPPPDRIGPLDELVERHEFRFAQRLDAWIDVERGRVTGYGQSGHGVLGATRVGVGERRMAFPAVEFPDIRHDPIVGDDYVTFSQTAGGRTALPAPRRVGRRPFVRVEPPIAWTTLSLTLRASGGVERGVVGASPFPRHWIYDDGGELVAKTGLIDFKSWYADAFGLRTPWGAEDSPAIVTEVESALERELSSTIMRGGERPEVRQLPAGARLVEQGAPGDELYVLLDGVVRVEVDGEPLAEVGPGAILGERALLEGGTRTSALVTVTPARVAVARGDAVDRAALAEVARGHRREEGR